MLSQTKTHPNPDCVSLSARSAFDEYTNSKLGKSLRKQKFLYLTVFTILPAI
jgi:hypothetical protein